MKTGLSIKTIIAIGAVGVVGLLLIGGVLFLNNDQGKQDKWDEGLIPFDNIPNDFIEGLREQGLTNLSNAQMTAAYNLMNNSGMTDEQKIACFDQLLDPNDPYGNVRIAKVVLFPTTNTISEAHSLMDKYYLAKTTIGFRFGYGNDAVTFLGLTAPTKQFISPESEKWANYIAEPQNQNAINNGLILSFTFDDGRIVPIGSVQDYIDVLDATLGVSFLKTVNTNGQGMEGAKQLPSYKDWFTPVEGGGGGPIPIL